MRKECGLGVELAIKSYQIISGGFADTLRRSISRFVLDLHEACQALIPYHQKLNCSHFFRNWQLNQIERKMFFYDQLSWRKMSYFFIQFFQLQ